MTSINSPSVLTSQNDAIRTQAAHTNLPFHIQTKLIMNKSIYMVSKTKKHFKFS